MEVAGNGLTIEALASFQKNAQKDTKNRALHAGQNARRDIKASERIADLNVLMISMKDYFIAKNLPFCPERAATRQSKNVSKITELLVKKKLCFGTKSVLNTTIRLLLVALLIALRIWRTLVFRATKISKLDKQNHFNVLLNSSFRLDFVTSHVRMAQMGRVQFAGVTARMVQLTARAHFASRQVSAAPLI